MRVAADWLRGVGAVGEIAFAPVGFLDDASRECRARIALCVLCCLCAVLRVCICGFAGSCCMFNVFFSSPTSLYEYNCLQFMAAVCFYVLYIVCMYHFCTVLSSWQRSIVGVQRPASHAFASVDTFTVMLCSAAGENCLYATTTVQFPL